MTIERFEEAYSVVKSTLEKAGLTDEEIRDALTKVFSPTAEETKEMMKSVISKLNGK